MNYTKIHDSIINNAKNRIIARGIYCEKHHIIPKCLGGNNEKYNIVKLYAREHFLIHWLLHRMYPNHKGLAVAFSRCSQTNRVNRFFTPSSRSYAEAREAHSKIMKDRTVSLDTRNKMSKSKKGKPAWNKGKKGYLSQEVLDALSVKRTGVILSQDHKLKISNGNRGKLKTSLRKSILKIDMDFKIIQIFESRVDACKNIAKNITTYSSKSNLKFTCGGFYWKYLEDTNEEEIKSGYAQRK